MTNPTVMGFGIVMVAAHFVRMFHSRKKTKIISKKNITNTLIYGCCFLPCLIPFIWFYCNLGTFNPTSVELTQRNIGTTDISTNSNPAADA